MTGMIYLLMNLGEVLWVFELATILSTSLVLNLSAIAWSGAYVLFALGYNLFLLRPSLDGEERPPPHNLSHWVFSPYDSRFYFLPGDKTTTPGCCLITEPGDQVTQFWL